MKTSTPTPTPRPALKATGMRRRHARCFETELTAATTERDQFRAEVERLETDYADYAFWKDAAKTRANHLESASQQMLAHEDTILQLRAEVERLKTCGIVELAAINSSVLEYCKHWEARAERAEAEVKRLGHLEAVLRSCAFDKDGTAWKTVCGWWSKKYDAVERQMSENATRAERAEADLAKERARLDSGQILLTVAGERVWHCGVDLRAAIDAAMKEGAK